MIRNINQTYKQLPKLWGINQIEMEKTKKAVEAFSYAMKKNYPVPPKDWALISIYKAHLFLSEHISRNTLDSYRKQGFLRGRKGLVYEKEIQFLKEGLDAIQFLFDKGIMGREKIEGKKYIVVYPDNVKILKQSPLDQKTKSFAKTVRSRWLSDWIDAIDLSE